ncbi:hypothetical protein BG004_003600 [Podila humilis]|nr:hypothetical protein BG004_003600 [Podila humilis]
MKSVYVYLVSLFVALVAVTCVLAQGTTAPGTTVQDTTAQDTPAKPTTAQDTTAQGATAEGTTDESDDDDEDKDDPEEVKKKRALAVYDIVCKKERGTYLHGVASPLRKDFYSCIQCCQSMEPYKALDDPSAIARQQITGTREFNEKSRRDICDNAILRGRYNAARKAAIEKVTGSLKYTNEKDLAGFFERKNQCYEFCGTSATPADNPLCIPFTPDGSVKV